MSQNAICTGHCGDFRDIDEPTYFNVEHFLLPTDAHNVKKRRVIKTF